MKKIEEITRKIKPLNTQLMEKTQERLNNLTKPRGSLGSLEKLAKKIVGITGKENPPMNKKVIFTLASDHGVIEEGVSLFPQKVTLQMVSNFLQGKAAINVLSKELGIKVIVIDIGVARDLPPHPDLVIKKVGYGTKNIAKEPAMSRNEAIRSIETGIDIFEEELGTYGINIMGTGEMGIGNTTPSSAIISFITGASVKEVAGRGTGINNNQLQNKIRVIKKALEVNHPNPKDPLDILAKIGGYEIGGLAGCILAAASHRIPVVVDGFISTASALIATKLAPLVKDYFIASHRSKEKGHRIALKYLGKVPLLDLNMRLGEGTGATLGITLAHLSIKILTEMATFEEAKISREKN